MKTNGALQYEYYFQSLDLKMVIKLLTSNLLIVILILWSLQKWLSMCQLPRVS